jgi:type IV secretion system protein VirB6
MSLFVGLGQSIDNLTNSFVLGVSSSISVAIAPLVATGFSIWITIYGYAVMRNEVSDPFNVFFKNVIKNAFISVVALGVGFYQDHIIGSIYGFQDGMVATVTKSTSITSINGSNVLSVIDNLNDKGGELAGIIMAAGLVKLPVGGYLDIIAGYVVIFANAVLMIVCGCLALNAKLALALVLALGPLFIATLAFPVTARFFEAWMSKVLNYVLLTILLALSVAASIAIADSYLTNAINQVQSPLEPVNRITESVNFFVVYIILAVFTLQTPQIAAALSGGVSLSGGGFGQAIARSVMRSKLGGIGRSGQASSTQSGDSIGKGNGEGASRGAMYSSGRIVGSAIPAYKRASHRKYGDSK